MIWLTWRLQRIELTLVVLMFLGLTGILLLSHDDVESVVRMQTDPACMLGIATPATDCFEQPSQFYRLIEVGLPFFNFLPLIAAMLLALPLVTELENGTFRFAWTQSITRGHWTRIKVGTLIVLGIAVAAIFAAAFHWWSSPKDAAYGRLGVDDYDLRGTLPIAHTIFAIGLMLAAGTVLRRSIPAIAVASLAYLCIRIPFMVWVREHLVSPETVRGSTYDAASNVGDWQLRLFWEDASGKQLDEATFFKLCQPIWTHTNPLDCEATLGLTRYMTYHPADHYWPLQLVETGIFLAAGLALIGLAAWFMVRRIE